MVSHLILPSLVLATFALAYIARMTRSFMLDQLNQEYVLTAKVKGVSEFAVIWRHAFRNVLVQLIADILVREFAAHYQAAQRVSQPCLPSPRPLQDLPKGRCLRVGPCFASGCLGHATQPELSRR